MHTPESSQPTIDNKKLKEFLHSLMREAQTGAELIASLHHYFDTMNIKLLPPGQNLTCNKLFTISGQNINIAFPTVEIYEDNFGKKFFSIHAPSVL